MSGAWASAMGGKAEENAVVGITYQGDGGGGTERGFQVLSAAEA